MMSDWLMYILIIGMMLPEMIIGVKSYIQSSNQTRQPKNNKIGSETEISDFVVSPQN